MCLGSGGGGSGGGRGSGRRRGQNVGIVPKNDATFLEEFGLVVVVDLEAREQDLVLIFREGALWVC
jgi:hypothetical protein